MSCGKLWKSQGAREEAKTVRLDGNYRGGVVVLTAPVRRCRATTVPQRQKRENAEMA